MCSGKGTQRAHGSCPVLSQAPALRLLGLLGLQTSLGADGCVQPEFLSSARAWLSRQRDQTAGAQGRITHLRLWGSLARWGLLFGVLSFLTCLWSECMGPGQTGVHIPCGAPSCPSVPSKLCPWHPGSFLPGGHDPQLVVPLSCDPVGKGPRSPPSPDLAVGGVGWQACGGL